VRFGNGRDIITSVTANFDASASYKKSYSEVGEYRQKTVPVGSFPANALGLCDMSGNVWEWCSDWYDANYYKNSPRKNPQGSGSGTYRVLRGGSWLTRSECMRVASRRGLHPSAGRCTTDFVWCYLRTGIDFSFLGSGVLERGLGRQPKSRFFSNDHGNVRSLNSMVPVCRFR